MVLIHGLVHFSYVGTEFSYSLRALGFFPGVPIFFFVSGFLITGSYERSADIRQYLTNRILRIFPALWTCFGVSMLLVYVSGYLDSVVVSVGQFSIWAVSQLSFVQFYNPAFMRGYGVGSLNGSLWAIPVELQFYLLVPLLMWLFGKSRRHYFVVLLIFAGINTFNSLVVIPMESNDLFVKLFQVTFLPWLAIFMLGQAAWLFRSRIKGVFENHFPAWLTGYVFLIALGLLFEDATGTQVSSNNISLFWMVPLCGLVLAAAYSYQGTAQKILQGNDISYGIYIFHMPIFNFALYQTTFQGHERFLTSIAVVFVAAIASWKLVERPALRFKTNTLFSR